MDHKHDTAYSTISACPRIEMSDTQAKSVSGVVPSFPSELPGKKYRDKLRVQFAALCFTLFLEGWNDGSTGPLLPRIQRVYHVCSSLFWNHSTRHMNSISLGRIRSSFSSMGFRVYCRYPSLHYHFLHIQSHHSPSGFHMRRRNKCTPVG